MSNKHKTPASFWTYQPDAATPDARAEYFTGTQDQWESLSPGMRREIVRQWERAVARERRAAQ